MTTYFNIMGYALFGITLSYSFVLILKSLQRLLTSMKIWSGHMFFNCLTLRTDGCSEYQI